MATADASSMIEQAFSDAVEGADGENANAAVLDAARELFARQGIHRTTMDDVARRAGLSRITVYRRVASKEALVEQVVRREFRSYFDQFLLDISAATTAAERVTVGFVSSLRALRANPLIQSLQTGDPERFAFSVLGEGGRTMTDVRRFVAGRLRREQAAGHVAAEVDVDLVAELMVRVSASFLLVPSELVDLDDDEQLAGIARKFLAPMLG